MNEKPRVPLFTTGSFTLPTFGSRPLAVVALGGSVPGPIPVTLAMCLSGLAVLVPLPLVHRQSFRDDAQ